MQLCRYQVCLFCLDRLKLECGSLCPGCRTEYGSEKNPFSKPAAKQKHAARAAPASRPDPPANRQAQRTDSNAVAQASPPVRPRPLNPQVELTANSLRPGTAKPPVSPAKEPEQPIVHPALEAPATSHQPAQDPGWQAGELSTLPQPVLPMHTAESSRSSVQHSPTSSHADVGPGQFQLGAQPPPRPTYRAHSNGTLHDEQQDAAVRWLFQHLGLERLPPVAPDPKGQALLQSVRTGLAAGHITASQGAEQLVAFINQRGTSQVCSSGTVLGSPCLFSVLLQFISLLHEGSGLRTLTPPVCCLLPHLFASCHTHRQAV